LLGDACHVIRLGCLPTTATHAGSIALGGTPAGLAPPKLT
jgi:hypothetical protein